VPVSDFRLDLDGGKEKGLIVNSVPLCGSKSWAKVRMLGQNNRRANTRLRLAARCGKASRVARMRKVG
jgi:hypothetical protein